MAEDKSRGVEFAMDIYDEDIFAPLRREFAAELPIRLASLSGHYRNWQASGAAESVTGMIHESHKLAGTAGALGFHGIGEEMCLIEQLLRAKPVDELLTPETSELVEKALRSCYRQAGLESTGPQASALKDSGDG
jgi:HPt (histidine-containing phosphotransfer) domain-containing protein